MAAQLAHSIRQLLDRGLAIPAVPMALTAERKFDERRQRALLRYYAAAGMGGMAVGVHTTQFAIRDPKYALFEPVLRVCSQVMTELDRGRSEPLVRVGGICGATPQAAREAEFLREAGYHTGLVNLVALKNATEGELIAHLRTLGEIIPIFGFHLGVGIGGRDLPVSFWRRFAELEAPVAIKIACFDRYQTIDCVRAIAEAGRDDISLYTGNDDNILLDLVTPFEFQIGKSRVTRRIVGGLLGHWAVWAKCAVEHVKLCQHLVASGSPIRQDFLRLATEVTDSNAALFDPAHKFAGCIPGLEEVLRRQGLFAGTWCLNPAETLSPGQAAEIDRVYAAYPHLTDDTFVRENRDEWLA